MIAYADILALATRVFGSEAAAKSWLANHRVYRSREATPRELMATSEGMDAIKTLLMQMEYGVYP
jgi:uncharacterized protein (DUF2384 family)